MPAHPDGGDVERSSRNTSARAGQGPAAEVRRSEERGRVLAALSGAVRELGVSEIMAAAALPSRNAADHLLFKMVRDGEIVRIARGTYGLPDPAGSEADKIGKKVRSITQVIDNAEEIGVSPILSPQQ